VTVQGRSTTHRLGRCRRRRPPVTPRRGRGAAAVAVAAAARPASRRPHCTAARCRGCHAARAPRRGRCAPTGGRCFRLRRIIWGDAGTSRGGRRPMTVQGRPATQLNFVMKSAVSSNVASSSVNAAVQSGFFDQDACNSQTYFQLLTHIRLASE